MMRLPRVLVALACCAVPGASAVAKPPPHAGPSGVAAAPVLVYYPAGDCGGELELEIYDRVAGAWRPHPDHPRVPTGSCQRELPDQLLNELRVRCADPAGRRPPSDWVVGAELPGALTPCAAAPPD
jgi:hypothetical protein